MSEQFSTDESFPAALSATLSPYSKFKMALKSREVQRQYPNLLERFLDFCRFEGVNVEQKSVEFYRFVTNNSQDNIEDVIIRLCYLRKRGDNQ